MGCPGPPGFSLVEYPLPFNEYKTRQKHIKNREVVCLHPKDPVKDSLQTREAPVTTHVTDEAELPLPTSTTHAKPGCSYSKHGCSSSKSG